MDGYQSQNYRCHTTTPHTLRIVAPIFAERQRSVPRLGDIWIPKSVVSSNHFARFYIPGVEDLFQTGDRVVRVEHAGSRFRLISWRIWRIWKGSGSSSKNLQMSRVFPFSHPTLHL
jgi:hypothetical protein